MWLPQINQSEVVCVLYVLYLCLSTTNTIWFIIVTCHPWTFIHIFFIFLPDSSLLSLLLLKGAVARPKPQQLLSTAPRGTGACQWQNWHYMLPVLSTVVIKMFPFFFSFFPLSPNLSEVNLFHLCSPLVFTTNTKALPQGGLWRSVAQWHQSGGRVVSYMFTFSDVTYPHGFLQV